MRTPLVCVCFALIVHRGGRATTDEDFKPTPIPLNEWAGEKGAAAAQLAAAVASTAAAPGPHYWEDALRHSVYLTFVRDKIDQLIAKGVTPDTKLDAHASNDIDDHNLWEKIKAAPFDRLSADEPPVLGSITLMAKGRLLDIDGEFRFTEDELLKERCDEKCMQGVKALWSVKRVRQKDMETIPGKYHYELTFSVNSQTPKKLKKPFDNPVRTFTVRDGTPVEQPTQPTAANVPRPQRAVWLHKNISPVRSYHTRNQPQGLDRLFLSLFGSDEESEPPRPVRPHPYGPPVYASPQHAKTGYVTSPTEQYQQKKPHHPVYKYSRPPLGSPPTVSQAEHHYMDTDKLKIPFAPPQVHYRFPDSDGKIKVPISPPQVKLPQNLVDDKINNVYPLTPFQAHAPVQTHVSVKTLAPVHPEHSDSDNISTPIPFAEEVQSYLDKVVAKYPLPSPVFQYPYDVTTNQPHFEPHAQAHHQHIELEPVRTKNPSYAAQPDYRFQPSNVVRTTKPAVLPTPPTGLLNVSTEATKNLNSSELTTKEPEIITGSKLKTYNKKHPMQKPPPQKISSLYFPEHVRPPVFNAPPGVFMPVDKKPFKPMPPLKYHQNYHTHSKHVKTRPVDFRPSPQVVDIQLFSDPDPLSDAFRPMPVGMNYKDNVTDSNEISEKAKHKGDLHKNLHSSKPTIKNDLIKPERTTTNTPDIITAQNLPQGESSIQWASKLLTAIVKTASASEETETETTTYESTTTVAETTTTTVPTTTTDKQEKVTTTIASPKKRTRPPHKFVKVQKEKKHKRITTTTTTPSTNKSTTEKHHKKTQSDLTPQASSAATAIPKPSWQPKTKKQNDTTTTTTEAIIWEDVTTSQPTTTTWPSTTTTKLTTTSKLTTTTAAPEVDEPLTTRSKNRFRQSTLMYKGTSVNHDKWSMPVTENNRTKPMSNKSNQQQTRRKGSNFHGYVSSTPKNVDEEHHKAEHKDLSYHAMDRSTTEMLLDVIPVTTVPTKLEEKNEDVSDYASEDEEEEDSNESSSNEHGTGGTKDVVVFYNERDMMETSGEEKESQEMEEPNKTTDTTPATVKKSKCKKKKNQNLTLTEETQSYDLFERAVEPTTEKVTTTTVADIFTQIFGGYTVEGLPQINKTTELVAAGSENKEQIAETHDDLDDFLDDLEAKQRDNETSEYEEEDDDDVEADSTVDEKRSNRHADITYDEYRERPYSFLELMAME